MYKSAEEEEASYDVSENVIRRKTAKKEKMTAKAQLKEEEEKLLASAPEESHGEFSRSASLSRQHMYRGVALQRAAPIARRFTLFAALSPRRFARASPPCAPPARCNVCV